MIIYSRDKNALLFFCLTEEIYILDEKMDHYKQYPFEIYTITNIEEIINFNGECNTKRTECNTKRTEMCLTFGKQYVILSKNHTKFACCRGSI